MTREQALENALRRMCDRFPYWFPKDSGHYDPAALALVTEARRALALPHDSVNADMLAALRVAHHALEGRERKDVALDAVAAAIARATS